MARRGAPVRSGRRHRLPPALSEPWIGSEAGVAADDRRHAPATLRNRAPIADALAAFLPDAGVVLEMASGSGEHVAFLAERFPALDWQPSDFDPSALASIAAWTRGMGNVRTGVVIDAASPAWPIDRADAIFCANMVHIAPWDAALGLVAGAGRILPVGAPLILYGPFVRDGVATAESNLAFDVSLRSRDSEWGLRRLEDVADAASAHALALDTVIEMPANNLLAVFRKR